MELDVDYERDELIVDFTPGELDLDPRPSEDEKSASSKPITKTDTSKLEKSEERFVAVYLFLYRSQRRQD